MPLKASCPPKVSFLTFAVLKIFQVADEVIRFRLFGSGDQVGFGGAWVSVQDVVMGGPIEHRSFLSDHADMPAQAFLLQTAQVLAVDH